MDDNLKTLRQIIAKNQVEQQLDDARAVVKELEKELLRIIDELGENLD